MGIDEGGRVTGIGEGAGVVAVGSRVTGAVVEDGIMVGAKVMGIDEGGRVAGIGEGTEVVAVGSRVTGAIVEEGVGAIVGRYDGLGDTGCVVGGTVLSFKTKSKITATNPPMATTQKEKNTKYVFLVFFPSSTR